MADEANTRQADPDGEGGVHRLRDILVEEVSLVDRAANKRRFLVVKRSGGAPRGDTEGPGGASSPPSEARKKPKAKPGPAMDKRRRRAAGAADDAAVGKAGRRKPPWEKGDEDVDADKAAGEEADGEENEGEDDEEDEDEEEAETDKAAAGKDDEQNDDEQDEDEDEGADPAPGATKPPAGQRGGGKPAAKADDPIVMPADAKAAVLRVLAQALDALMGVANRIKDAEEPDDDTDVSVPDDVEESLEDIGELLENVAEQLPTSKSATAKSGVAKAGRRMAKDRLDRFQKALSLLSDVLKELIGDQAASAPSGRSAGPRASKQAGAPGIGDLLASVGELTQLMKRQQADLAEVRKTRATSNAISVEGARPRVIQDVSWPLDMNRPVSRDSVAKSVSFYEDP